MGVSTVETGSGRTARPGAYGTINGTALARRGPGIKRLVILATGEGGKPVTVKTDGRPTLLTATSAKGVKSLFRSGMARDAGLAAFSPSNDRRVSAPSTILFAKVNPATQGTLTLQNAAGDALTITSTDYGAFANLISVNVGTGTLQGLALTVTSDDDVQAGDNIGGDAVLSVRYDNTGEFTTAQLTIAATGVSITFTDQYAADVVANTPAAGTAITVASDDAYDVGQQVSVFGLVGTTPTKEILTLDGTTEVAGTALFDEITGMSLSGGTRGAVVLENLGASTTILSIPSSLTADHTPGAIEVVSGAAADTSQSITVTGLSVGGVQISETLALNGTTVVAGTLSFGKVLTARLTGAAAGNVIVRAAGAGAVAFTIAAASLTAGINLADGLHIPDKAAFSGPIQLKHADSPGVGTWVAVVRGRTDAGVLTAERVVLTDAFATTTTSWAEVDQIEIAAAEGSNAIDVAGTAIDCPVASFPYLSQVVGKINGYNGFEATALADKAPTFEIGRLDYADAAIKGANATEFYADLDAVILWINSSAARLVTATRASGASGAPSVTPSARFLIGGSEGTATQADWQAAMDALKPRRDIVVAVCSTNAAVLAAWVAHAQYMEGAGNEERNGHVPLALTLTKSEIVTQIRALNDRNTSAVAQSVDRFNENGVRTTYGPEVLAAMAAAMQAGSPVGTALTHKVINAISLNQHTSWGPDEDAEELLQAGLMFARIDDDVGLIWERSVTTWRNNDNPIFSEMGANESANESVRRLRRNLNLLIGEPAFDGQAGTVKAMAEAELELQVDEGIIKAYSDVGVEDAGDVFPIGYQLAALESTNFIPITANLQRSSSTA